MCPKYKCEKEVRMASTWFTTIGILLLGAAFGLQILYVLAAEAKESTERIEEYQIPAGIINGIVVVYILYSLLYYRPYGSKMGILISLFLLIGGTIAEIYLSVYEKNMPDAIATYFMLGFNILVRLYLIIDVQCETPLTSIPELVGQLAKPIVEAMPSPPPPPAPIAPPVDLMPLYGRVIQAITDLRGDRSDEQWRAVKDSVRNALGLTAKTGGRRR
jgi:hypothetical protein